MDASTSEGLPGYGRSGTIRWVVGSCLLIWNLKEVLSRGGIEERRRFVDFFVQGIRVDGKAGGLEAAFNEDPSLPGGSF